MLKNKFVAILLSAVIAFALWSYVITFISSDREDTFYNIPVAYQGEAILEERGMMITSEEKPTVTVTLRGNRNNLNKLDSSNITIIADLTRVYESGVQNLDYTISYPGDLPRTAFTVLSQYPTNIKVTVEQKVQKEVPVNVIYKGSVPTDYLADKEKAELDFDKVTISGPASVVDKITQARIEVDLTDRNASFIEKYRFTLCDAAGEPVDAQKIEVNVAEVELTLSILQVKEIPLKVNVIAGGGATEKTSKITIEPQTIKVCGSENVLAEIDELELGTIELGELRQDSIEKFAIKLPAGVKNLTGKEEAVVMVKFPDLATKVLTVTNITALNVPEGMEAEFMTEELLISVRGEKKLVQKMLPGDISVTVDFTGAQPGSFTIKANVVMGVGYTEVGALGTYEVSATLVEPEDNKKK